MLLKTGFAWLRSKDSHRIYANASAGWWFHSMVARRYTRKSSSRFWKPSRKFSASGFLPCNARSEALTLPPTCYIKG